MILFQYSKISEHLIENISKNQIYFNVVNKVNDPYEGIFNFNVKSELETDFIKLFYSYNYDEEIFKEHSFETIKREIIFNNVNVFLKGVGISCFSETNRSLVMWGNYADKHQGICIGYDSSFGVFKQAEKVQYLDSVYTLHINSARKIKEDFMLKNCSKCMLTKFSEWKYEKEWRIIFKPLKAFQYPIGVMKSVYFGLRTTEEDIHKVREASKHHTGLRYYMATLKPHEYNVVFNEMIFKD